MVKEIITENDWEGEYRLMDTSNSDAVKTDSFFGGNSEGVYLGGDLQWQTPSVEFDNDWISRASERYGGRC